MDAVESLVLASVTDWLTHSPKFKPPHWLLLPSASKRHLPFLHMFYIYLYFNLGWASYDLRVLFIIMIVDKHPNKCISGSTTGTWTSTSCGLTQSSTSLFPSSFWSSSTLSHSGLVVSLYFSLPITLCKRGLWFNLRFIYFLCIYYLQETHRALPKPPGKHRDDKRDQCEPAPRGKVTLPWLCRDYAVTLPWLCRDYAVTLPWLCRDFAVTLPWLCCDFAVTLPWLCRDVAVTLWFWSSVSRARHGGRLTTGNRPHRTGKAWLIKQENRKLRVISNSFDKLEN